MPLSIKEIEELSKEIDDEISALYDFRTVLSSIKVLLNYEETGKPYGEDDYAYY